MAEITLKGNKINTKGPLPEIGARAPEFFLTGEDLSGKTLADFAGKKVVLNIFPSVDTPVCAASVRRFNTDAASIEGVAVINISADLPFAQKRFCGAENIEGVVNLSTFRDHIFGTAYGVEMVDGPLAGLMARAVLVLDENGTIVWSELVPEIAQEPNYKGALARL